MDGSLAEIVEPGLIYGVFRDDGSDMRSVLEPLIGSGDKKWFISVINDHKYRNRGHYPFPLIIFDGNDLMDFYNGNFAVVAAANFFLLKKRLARHKLDVIPLADPDWALKITPFEEGVTMLISSHFFNRLFVECISYRWMCRELVHMVGEQEKHKDTILSQTPLVCAHFLPMK